MFQGLSSVIRRAFTLLELMIAIVLSAIIILTAVSGLRTMAQAVTAANRLSLENALMRAGYFTAQDQLDFWTNADDPTDVSRQKLRAQSLPFCPMYGAGGQGFHLVTDGQRIQGPTAPASIPRAAVTPSVFNVPVAEDIPGYLIGSPKVEIKPAPELSQAVSQLAVSESKIGWDPTLAWAPHDPKTWYHGNLTDSPFKWRFWDDTGGSADLMATKPGDLFKDTFSMFLHGRSAVITNVDDKPALFSYTISDFQSSAIPAVPAIPADSNDDWSVNIQSAVLAQTVKRPIDYTVGTEGVPHRWYQRQVLGLIGTLGYVGFMSYMPPNAIYGFYTGYQDVNQGPDLSKSPYGNQGDAALCHGNGLFSGLSAYSNSRTMSAIEPGLGTFFVWGNPATLLSRTRGLVGHTWQVLAAQPQFEQMGNEANLLKVTNKILWQHVADTSKEQDSLLTTSRYLHQVMGGANNSYRGPEAWPRVSVSVTRMLGFAHFQNNAAIQMQNPLTGKVIEFSWMGLGTSLRGARMQRKKTFGWAKWDNASSAYSTNDPHLDSR